MDAPQSGWELFAGDGLERMRGMPDGCIDAIITDPPYGTTKCGWDVAATDDAWWEQALRVTRPRAALVLFACGLFTADLMRARRSLYRYKWVWDRGDRPTGALDANRRPMRVHEDILVFGRMMPWYRPVKRAGPLTRTCGPGASKLYHTSYEGQNRAVLSCERHPTDIVRCDPPRRRAGDSGARVHPTQKPVELMSLLVRSYVPEGGLVLDPFAGSGTTGVAAALHGRRSILCEREPEFCEAIRRRMTDATPRTVAGKGSIGPPGVDEILGGRLF